MKTFDTWLAYEGSEERELIDHMERAYNAGASEKEKQMLEFAEWYQIKCQNPKLILNTKEAFEYWKENVKDEQ